MPMGKGVQDSRKQLHCLCQYAREMGLASLLQLEPRVFLRETAGVSFLFCDGASLSVSDGRYVMTGKNQRDSSMDGEEASRKMQPSKPADLIGSENPESASPFKSRSAKEKLFDSVFGDNSSDIPNAPDEI